MRCWAGITDHDWIETLRRLQPDEVNFWQPSQRAPRAMDAGWSFLFKLHSPRNFRRRTRNGLLLRADIHRLFDDGYVTVDPDLRFVVSPRLHEEFENGRVYYALDGRSLANVPDRLPDQPGREFLEWHNSEVYLG